MKATSTPIEARPEWDMDHEDEILKRHLDAEPWRRLPMASEREEDRQKAVERVQATLEAAADLADAPDAELIRVMSRRVSSDPFRDVLAAPEVAQAKAKLAAELRVHKERKRELDPFNPATCDRLKQPLMRELESPATSAERLGHIRAQLLELDACANGQRQMMKRAIQIRHTKLFRAHVLPAAESYIEVGKKVADFHHRQSLILEIAIATYHNLPQDRRLGLSQRAFEAVEHFRHLDSVWYKAANAPLSHSHARCGFGI
jgi:hypothetical protein